MDQAEKDRILAQRKAGEPGSRTGDLVNARQKALQGAAAGPHRVEYVATVRAVEYINDSKSTFLDSTLEALAAIDKPVVWIAGALGPEIARGHVQEFLKERVVALVLFGRGTQTIEALQPFTQHVYVAEELRTAVFVAHELSRSGEVVLFSPACPSGDGYANYEERGADFKRAVRDL
jgi:UDP-N-acetylmuramoylalanine--D-glutamate ligase